MKILAFDTTTKYLTVAVKDGEKILSHIHKDMGMNHSALLVSTIDSMLKEAQLELKDLDAIALSIGPGSFTGLRIGVSTAKALSLAAEIKVVSVPTLDVIAYNYIGKSEYIAPILDAKKKRVYSAFYRSLEGSIKKISDYLLTDIDSLLSSLHQPTLFFGDGLSIYKDYMKSKSKFVKISSEADWYPRGEIVAKLGMEKLEKGTKENIDSLAPMYLHPKECNVRGFKY